MPRRYLNEGLYMIRNILFDLDETLLDFKKSESMALSNMLKSIGVEPTREVIDRYSEINKSRWKLLEKGLLTRKQVKESRYELLFSELGVDYPAARATAYYEEQLSLRGFLFPDTIKLLEVLHGSYKLFIVSNGGMKVQSGRLADCGIGRYFEDIFISEAAGAEKPSVEFFDYCFRKRPDIKPEDTIIIGDSLTSDIQGGKNAGIRTVWFNPMRQQATDIQPDYEVYGLLDIPKLLENIKN